jgi:hypothetical protein
VEESAATIRAVVMPDRAVSIQGAVRVIDSGGRETGGPRVPVFVLSPSDLEENGGRFKLTGGKPIHMRLSTEGRIIGGACIAVYPVLADGSYDAGWGS